MESTIFLWIAIFVYTLAGIIGKLIRKETFNSKRESSFHRMYVFGSFLILILLTSTSMRYNYYKGIADNDREKYHIPCIDPSMELNRREKNEEVWGNVISLKQDSIQHYEKIIKIDRYGIFKEQDYYVNLIENKTLILETTLPGFLRKFRTKYKLIDDVIYFHRENAYSVQVIDSLQADSVLLNWRLTIDYNCNRNN